jgi:hypothetical protein
MLIPDRINIFLCVIITSIILARDPKAKTMEFMFYKTHQDSIPKSIAIRRGSLVEAGKWIDLGGTHYIVVQNMQKGEKFSSDWQSKLWVDQYSLKPNGLMVRDWAINDYSNDNVTEVIFNFKNIKLFDLDTNGIAETRFLYEMTREGDPRTFKYIIHFKSKKYPIRGEIPTGFDDSTDCEMNFDKSYSSTKFNFRTFANDDCKKLLRDNYSCFTR